MTFLLQVWQGVYQIPISQLNSARSIQVQVCFMGQMASGERWDNNSGANWQLCADVAVIEGSGLVRRPEQGAVSRNVISSLLLRLEALTASNLLTTQQSALLSTMAWKCDTNLLNTYQQNMNAEDASLAGMFYGFCDTNSKPGLHVVHIASEMAPIAKVCCGRC